MAIAAASCWADVVQALGKRRYSGSTHIQRRAALLGYGVDHFDHKRSRALRSRYEIPFAGVARVSGRSGLSSAANWFMERGYVVSLPLENAVYDLITESDDGLKRVQVKTTNSRTREGRYAVKLARVFYDSEATATAHGKVRKERYKPGEIDYFFVVTGTHQMYLIPLEATGENTSIVLDSKYAAFLV